MIVFLNDKLYVEVDWLFTKIWKSSQNWGRNTGKNSGWNRFEERALHNLKALPYWSPTVSRDSCPQRYKSIIISISFMIRGNQPTWPDRTQRKKSYRSKLKYILIFAPFIVTCFLHLNFIEIFGFFIPDLKKPNELKLFLWD